MNNLPGLVRSPQKKSDTRKRPRSISPLDQDRIAQSRVEQQASASPALQKKKRMDEHETRHSTDDFPPSPNAGPRMPLTLDDFKNYMEKDIKPTLSNLKEDMVLLADQVANNKDNISEIRKDIAELQQRGPESGDFETNKYNFVRRCLRFWPISGSSMDTMWKNVRTFIHEKMKVPSSEMDESQICEIRRVRTSRNSGTVEEVLVVFRDIEARDLVASYAKNLAPFTRDGRPTAGMRTEVLSHLRGVYNLLQSHGYRLRQRYGDQLRRTIKFDEFNRSFYLSVKLPDEDDWSRISPETARLAQQAEELSSPDKARLWPSNGRAAVDVRQPWSHTGRHTIGQRQTSDRDQPGQQPHLYRRPRNMGFGGSTSFGESYNRA